MQKSDYDPDRESTEGAMISYSEGEGYGMSREEVDAHNQLMVYRYESQTGKKY